MQLIKNYHLKKYTLSSEILIIILSIYFSIGFNHNFWQNLIKIQNQLLTNKFVFLSSMLLIVILLQLIILTLTSLIAWGKNLTKCIMILLITLTVVGDYFSKYYGVYFNREMIANILHTNFAEAIELFNFSLILYYLKFGFFPSILIFFCLEIQKKSLIKHLTKKILLSGIYISMALLLISSQFKAFCTIIKNYKEIKYQLLPSSLLISSTRLLTLKHKKIKQPLIIIDPNATKLISSNSKTPTTVVLIIGETVRANNWGLSGYSRQTTPELAKLPIINFPYATSCGTNTDISLPCMFSPYGRVNYNEEKIRSTESILHLFNKMNIDVTWVDNQSGCKGVCDGLKYIEAKSLDTATTYCPKFGNCLDEILITGLQQHLITNSSNQDQIIILHQLGNHGPGYFARYPKEFNKFNPTCNSYDLTKCSNSEIINAYDNAILYTDWVLAKIIKQLDTINTINHRKFLLIYVSDHGESLGENNLYLHGMPYTIAPIEQKRVPMIFWYSKNFPINRESLLNKAQHPAHHDNLYHTLIKIFSIQSYTYNKELDLLND